MVSNAGETASYDHVCQAGAAGEGRLIAQPDDHSRAPEADHDAFTDRVIEHILDAGDAFFGGVTFRGQRCMRVSVSNWQTSDDDVDRAVRAVERAIAASRR